MGDFNQLPLMPSPMKRVVRSRVCTELVLPHITTNRNRRRVGVDAVGSSLIWAAFATGLAALLLVLLNGPRRTDRIRLDLTWRARMFVVVTVGVAAFLITLAVIV